MSLNRILDEIARLRNPIDKDEAVKILQASADDVEKCMDEEQDALDARPESLRWSAVNDDMGENISDLTDAACELENLAEECKMSGKYDYESIKRPVIKIVNLIKQVIHR